MYTLLSVSCSRVSQGLFKTALPEFTRCLRVCSSIYSRRRVPPTAQFIRRMASYSADVAAQNMTTTNLTVDFVPTCDLYDEYLDEARVPNLSWRSFGGKKAFCGPAVTVKCFEDNSRIKELVESAGDGRVLVVDAGASHRCAVLGDLLAGQAAENQWSGLVVNGCVRDVEALAEIGVGVVALGCTPRKSTRRGEGQVDLHVKIGDVECRPGDYVFCDLDGVLILSSQQVADRQSKQERHNKQD
jgi:regulator of ribonuclease activity A